MMKIILWTSIQIILKKRWKSNLPN